MRLVSYPDELVWYSFIYLKSAKRDPLLPITFTLEEQKWSLTIPLFHLLLSMPQRAWSWMNHLNPKISRQLIKCPSTWQAWACQEKSQSLLFFCLPVPPWEALLSLKGPRGIKASPTGRPDNSTRRVEGVHIGLQEGARVRELWMQQSALVSPSASLTNVGSNKDPLGQQHCWGSLQLWTLTSQPYQHPSGALPCCQGCRRKQGRSPELDVSTG